MSLEDRRGIPKVPEREVSRSPFTITTEKGKDVLLTDPTDLRLAKTFADIITPLYTAARVGSNLITGHAAMIGYQSLMEDREPRGDLNVVNILIPREPVGRKLRDMMFAFRDLPFPKQDKKLIVKEHDGESGGYRYQKGGILLQVKGYPLVDISDRWEKTLSAEETNGDLFNVSVSLPTIRNDEDIFGCFMGEWKLRDSRPGKKETTYLSFIDPHLARLMSIASGEEEDIPILEVLARMGAFRGDPTLFPTGQEYEDLMTAIRHKEPSVRESFEDSLQSIQQKVPIEIRWTKEFARLLDTDALPEEDRHLPSDADPRSKGHEWRVLNNLFDRPFRERDATMVLEEMSSAEEHNRKYTKEWLTAAEEYEGGRAKFWTDLFTLSTQAYIKDQYINVSTYDPMNYLVYDLTDTFHSPEHTGKAVVQVGEIMDAMIAVAPEFVSPIQKNTAKAADAGHDVIQLSELVEEKLQFGDKTIHRIKRQPKTGHMPGYNEYESAEVTKRFMKFVNSFYDKDDPVFDPELGYDCVMSTAPIRNPDGTVIQNVFEARKQRPAVQAVLLADLGPENGLAKGEAGIKELKQNSWGIIWEQEAEVKAACFGYRLKKDAAGNFIAEDISVGGDWTESEQERLADIIKARLLGQKNLHNFLREKEGENARIAEQISQMDPRVQPAMTAMFQPSSRESHDTLAIMTHYYEELQTLPFDALLWEQEKVRRHMEDVFAETHTLPENFPLYHITQPEFLAA